MTEKKKPTKVKILINRTNGEPITKVVNGQLDTEGVDKIGRRLAGENYNGFTIIGPVEIEVRQK